MQIHTNHDEMARLKHKRTKPHVEKTLMTRTSVTAGKQEDVANVVTKKSRWTNGQCKS